MRRKWAKGVRGETLPSSSLDLTSTGRDKPPDEDPGWEPDPEDPDAPPLPELDSEDVEPDEDELVTLTDAVSAGMQVAAPPEAELLEYKSAAGAALVGRSLIFNWVGIGWCAGTIESAEKDGRRKSKARVA